MRNLRIGEVKKLEIARKWMENALRLTQFKNVTHTPPVAQTSLASFCHVLTLFEPISPHVLIVPLKEQKREWP